MKRGVLLLCLSLLCILAFMPAVSTAEVKKPGNGGECIAPAAMGGPDAFGYRYIDSVQPGGPTYNWIEIATAQGGTGTSVGFNGVDDNYAGPFDIGFTFNFYGTDYTQFFVGSNGTVYFMNQYLGLSNTCIPGTNGYGVQTYIAHWWDDLYFGTPMADVFYEVQGTPGSRRLIIEYYNVVGCCSNYATGATWQVILYEGSNKILMQYQNTNMNDSYSNGAGATIGIQGTDVTPPTWGLNYSCNTGSLFNGLAILFSPKACTPPPANMVAWWPAEGTANDMRGTNNGSLVGGATFAAGKVGQAFSFNGTSGAVTANIASVATDNITMDAWVKWGGVNGSLTHQVIFYNGNTSTSGYGLFLTPTGTLSVLLGGVVFMGTGSTLTQGTWQHVAAVRNSGVWSVYLDGIAVPFVGVNPSSSPNPPAGNILIGGHVGGTLEVFHGEIDEVEFFGRALSAAEIQAIYGAGSAGKCRSCTGNIQKFTGWDGTMMPFAGVPVELSGSATATTTTDAHGNFSLPIGVTGSYVVTPALTGYSFMPTSRNVTAAGVDVAGQNFVGSYTGGGTYSISGTVTTGTWGSWGGIRGVSGVTINLTGGATATTTTDGTGNYSFTGLLNGSYAVTPVKTGYTFTPVNRTIVLSGANVTGQNFTSP